jgi:hypothetical protein
MGVSGYRKAAVCHNERVSFNTYCRRCAPRMARRRFLRNWPNSSEGRGRPRCDRLGDPALPVRHLWQLTRSRSARVTPEPVGLHFLVHTELQTTEQQLECHIWPVPEVTEGTDFTTEVQRGRWEEAEGILVAGVMMIGLRTAPGERRTANAQLQRRRCISPNS